jgi:hypothetical protein
MDVVTPAGEQPGVSGFGGWRSGHGGMLTGHR